MATSEIANLQNYTAFEQAAAQQVKGPNNEMNQDMFLKLMMEQLKYQDPLNPMSNQDFLAQQAQFTQLNELQKISTQLVSNNTVQQCVSLIGKEVELVNPDDPETTIKGIVTEAVFDANGSSIKVNGKNYPLGLVTGIREPGSADATTPGDETATTPEQTAQNTQPTSSEILNSLGSNVSKIAQLAGFLIDKYIK